MSALLKTVGGLLVGPLISGGLGRVTRHAITPAAILAAGSDGLAQGAMEALQQEAHVLGAALGAFVVSLILSKVSDAVQELKAQR